MNLLKNSASLAGIKKLCFRLPIGKDDNFGVSYKSGYSRGRIFYPVKNKGPSFMGNKSPSYAIV